MLNRRKLLLISALFLAVVPVQSATIAPGDFDDPAEGLDGWTAIGDEAFRPSRIAIVGNSGGFLQVVDSVSGGVVYRVAPEKFLGQQSVAYGFSPDFDLKQSSTASQFGSPDILLAGGGLTLAYTTSNNPFTTRTDHAAPLVAAGWRVNSLTGANATEAQMRADLIDLTGIRIRAEYAGNDTDGPDDIVLYGAAIPKPASILLVPAGMLVFFVLRRRCTPRIRRRRSLRH